MLYVLVNKVNGMYFERENEYYVCKETNKFVMAKTFKERKNAEYANSFLKNDYEVVGINDMMAKKITSIEIC